MPPTDVGPLILWQMASGVAHSNSNMMILLLEREGVDLSEPTSEEHNMSTSVGTLAVFYRVALDMVEALIELIDTHNQLDK